MRLQAAPVQLALNLIAGPLAPTTSGKAVVVSGIQLQLLHFKLL